MNQRAVYLPWLRGPQRQLEFVIDGLPLHERWLAVPAPDADASWLDDPWEMPIVVDLSWPSHAARTIAGDKDAD